MFTLCGMHLVYEINYFILFSRMRALKCFPSPPPPSFQAAPANVTSKGFDCFKVYFESVNQADGKLRKGSSPQFVRIHFIGLCLSMCVFDFLRFEFSNSGNFFDSTFRIGVIFLFEYFNSVRKYWRIIIFFNFTIEKFQIWQIFLFEFTN